MHYMLCMLCIYIYIYTYIDFGGEYTDISLPIATPLIRCACNHY